MYWPIYVYFGIIYVWCCIAALMCHFCILAVCMLCLWSIHLWVLRRPRELRGHLQAFGIILGASESCFESSAWFREPLRVIWRASGRRLRGQWAVKFDKMSSEVLPHIQAVRFYKMSSEVLQNEQWSFRLCWSIDWLIHWLIVWLIDWLIDWLINQSIRQSNNQSITQSIKQ
jgi:hypothetical protein